MSFRGFDAFGVKIEAAASPVTIRSCVFEDTYGYGLILESTNAIVFDCVCCVPSD